jgi:hypothetical protein
MNSLQSLRNRLARLLPGNRPPHAPEAFFASCKASGIPPERSYFLYRAGMRPRARRAA